MENLSKDKQVKIGIITQHSVNNFGANLQSYALNEFLKLQNYDSKLIDFIPNNKVQKDLSFRQKIKNIIKFFLKKEYKNDFLKNKKFSQFRNKYYGLFVENKRFYGDTDFLINYPKLDIYISGSDQLFNFSLTGHSVSYFLPFETNGLKISYASSFGRETITDSESYCVKNYLTQFSSVSFREKSGSTIYSKLTSKNSLSVLDPVFLLSEEQWSKLITRKINRKYILVYAVENSKFLKDAIQLAKKLIHHISYGLYQ